jgi:hypothetical protein
LIRERRNERSCKVRTRIRLLYCTLHVTLDKNNKLASVAGLYDAFVVDHSGGSLAATLDVRLAALKLRDA